MKNYIQATCISKSSYYVMTNDRNKWEIDIVVIRNPNPTGGCIDIVHIPSSLKVCLEITAATNTLQFWRLTPVDIGNRILSPNYDHCIVCLEDATCWKCKGSDVVRLHSEPPKG